MTARLATPELGPLDDDLPATPARPPRPDLRGSPHRQQPDLESLVRPGFVTAAVPPPPPAEPIEALTIEVPRRLKRALQAEVAARRSDPARRAVASMKSVILEALAAHGYADLIDRADIEVQAGIFMKRQAARLGRA